MRSISAGKFKDTCLRILDEVAATRTPVMITKWGRPVARLTPVISQTSAQGLEVPAASGVEETIRPYRSESGSGEATTPRLHRLAAELGVSPDTLLQQALDAYVGDSALADLIERAKRPVGAFRSGRTDIAAKHDQVLEEILVEDLRLRRLPE